MMIDCDAIEHVCKLYINSAHAVFNLIPPRFGTYLDDCYEQILCPSVDHHTVWTVYLHLLDEIHQCTEALSILELFTFQTAALNSPDDNELLLLVELEDLHFDEVGNYYMGGVRGGLGLSKCQDQFFANLIFRGVRGSGHSLAVRPKVLHSEVALPEG